MSVPLISTVTRRRATAVSFGGALGLALLAGCGAPAPQTSAVPAVKGPVTLELWDRNDPLYVKFVESWLPTFQSKQPLVKVNFVPTGLSNDDKFITGMASGTPPDVVLMNG